MAGWARPVRTVPKSSLATETAFSIFSSAPKRISSITVAPVGPLPAWDAWAARRASGLHVPSARRYPSPPLQRQQQASRVSAAGPRRTRPGLPSARLADLEPGEGQHVDALLGQDLLDGLLRVLHERLLGQHDVFEERAQPALHDLADSLLGL